MHQAAANMTYNVQATSATFKMQAGIHMISYMLPMHAYITACMLPTHASITAYMLPMHASTTTSMLPLQAPITALVIFAPIVGAHLGSLQVETENVVRVALGGGRRQLGAATVEQEVPCL